MSLVVTAKLIDGTEIVGVLKGETPETACITHPLQIIYKYSLSSHVPDVTFTRFMMFADLEEFEFQKVDFLVLTPAIPELATIHAKMAANLYKTKASVEKPTDTEMSEVYTKLLHSIPSEDMTKH